MSFRLSNDKSISLQFGALNCYQVVTAFKVNATTLLTAQLGKQRFGEPTATSRVPTVLELESCSAPEQHPEFISLPLVHQLLCQFAFCIQQIFTKSLYVSVGAGLWDTEMGQLLTPNSIPSSGG